MLAKESTLTVDVPPREIIESLIAQYKRWNGIGQNEAIKQIREDIKEYKIKRSW